MYMYMYTVYAIYIYIYIERERYTYIYIYIYVAAGAGERARVKVRVMKSKGESNENESSKIIDYLVKATVGLKQTKQTSKSNRNGEDCKRNKKVNRRWAPENAPEAAAAACIINVLHYSILC